jgi:hypothetical protein
MKYSQRDNLVASLREAADFIEAHGIELPFNITVSLGAHIATFDRKTYESRDPKEMRRELKQAVRILKPVKKEYYGSTLYVKKRFGTAIELSLTASRSVACKQVKTGKTTLVPAVLLPARMEEEIEWVCTDPILRASK